MFKKYNLFIVIVICFFTACINKNIEKPEWITDPNSNIGVAGFIPSENFAKQKAIAVKKAINSLLIKKGIINGSINTMSEKVQSVFNDKKSYYRTFSQNSNIVFKFHNIEYKIRIVDIYKDKETGELYVRIEEEQ